MRMCCCSLLVLAGALLAASAHAKDRSVLDYATVEAAIEACQDGDRLYFPGTPAGETPRAYPAPRGGWVIRANIEIYGDGTGLAGDDSGTSIRPFSRNDPVFVLQAPLRMVHIHDLKIRHERTPARRHPGNRAITCTTEPGKKVTYVTLERVLASNMGDDAFHFEAVNPGDAAIIMLRMENCEASNGGGSGLYMRNCVASVIDGGLFGGNLEFGAYVDASGGTDFRSVAFEGNNKAPVETASGEFDVQLRLKGSHAFTVDGCHFETFDEDPRLGVRKTAITVEQCYGGRISGNTLGNDSTVAGSRGVFIVSGSKGIHVGPNHWSHTEVLVEIHPDDGNSNCTVMPQAVQHYDPAMPPRIVIPDEDSGGNFAFMPVHLETNVGGALLLPRVSTTVRDSIEGRAGLVVYNSTQGALNVHDGRAWRPVGASGAQFVGANDLTQVSGSRVEIAMDGTYPDVRTYAPFAVTAGEAPQAWSCTVQPTTPGDIEVRALIHSPDASVTPGDAVFRVHYAVLGREGGGAFAMSVAVGSEPAPVSLGVIPGSFLQAGDVLRLTVERATGDSRDRLAGTAGLSGIILGPAPN